MTSSNDLRIVGAVRETLRAELERDDRIIVYGEDVGRDGGVFRATEDLQDRFPEQVYDAPLAEAGIIGVGVGLAAAGLVPVPEIQFQGFIYQAFHQLQQHVSRIRSRSRGTVTCPMTIRTPYGGGINALEHHGESYEAGFAHIPGLKVVIPSSPVETAGLLRASIRDPDPVVFMEPTRLYRTFRESVPDEHVIPLGEGRIVEAGSDLTVVSWGSMLRETLDAVESVDADVEVIDPRTITPFDTELVASSVKKTGRCVVVHEAPRTGGFAAEIAARINEEALHYLEAPVGRVTAYDVPQPFFAREDAYRPDAARIARTIRETMQD
ncbi:alpha-ketoacid dehydrogenase subunit beta [Halobellus salinisoli]|uniref:alpha-ketoacid dehydrogenase subunit beta n=1 Tax=Halobellus salinisoli TaxID=3108500 RepID=UPI0030099239